MPRHFVQYRIFIGSPGGLEAERHLVASRIEAFNRDHGEPDGFLFKAVGWEDTLPAVGRPQGLIIEDLRSCDYALFLFHDRWGTAAGKDGRVGTEEEWDIAVEMYKTEALRNLSLFFKTVPPHQLRDPGNQLQRVVKFRAAIKEEWRHLFCDFDKISIFSAN